MKLPWKKLGFLTLYTFYLTTALTAISYAVFFRPFVGGLRGLRKPPEEALQGSRHVPLETVRRLGWFQATKDSSFSHFDQDKPSGSIRLCAIGCSFTYGQEVGPSDDYPSMLQKRFEKRGVTNVEVLNFGSGWWGFHQTYIMWDEVARGFDCDFVLFGPETFYPKRDTALNHTDLFQPYFLHSRFILHEGGIKRIDVAGTTLDERFDHYFRFFTPLRYLRYDRSPPIFLKALIPKDRTIVNPFYYYSGTALEEALETYRILLGMVARDDVGILVSHYSEEEDVVNAAREVGTANLAAFSPLHPMSFPYLAPRGHNSPLGNDLLARQYLRQLVPEARGEPLPLFATRDLKSGGGTTAGGTVRRPLREYDGVWIEAANGLAIGNFGYHVPRDEASGPDQLAKAGAVSLLALKNPGQSVLDGCFLPLGFPLAPGAEVTLEVQGSPKSSLGRVGWIDDRLALGVLSTGSIDFKNQEELVLKRAPSNRAIVKIGNRPILRGTTRRLRSVGRECLRLRATQEAFFDLDSLAEGRFDLVLSDDEDGDLRIPIATWKRVYVEGPVVKPGLDRLLAVENATAVVVR